MASRARGHNDDDDSIWIALQAKKQQHRNETLLYYTQSDPAFTHLHTSCTPYIQTHTCYLTHWVYERFEPNGRLCAVMVSRSNVPKDHLWNIKALRTEQSTKSTSSYGYHCGGTHEVWWDDKTRRKTPHLVTTEPTFCTQQTSRVVASMQTDMSRVLTPATPNQTKNYPTRHAFCKWLHFLDRAPALFYFGLYLHMGIEFRFGFVRDVHHESWLCVTPIWFVFVCVCVADTARRGTSNVNKHQMMMMKIEVKERNRYRQAINSVFICLEKGKGMSVKDKNRFWLNLRNNFKVVCLFVLIENWFKPILEYMIFYTNSKNIYYLHQSCKTVKT